MEDFTSNSDKARRERAEAAEQERKAEKMISGKVITKKPSLISKLTDVFFQKDPQELREYVVSDIVIPSIKDMVSDVVRNGIDYILYGETRGSKSKAKPLYGNASYVNYNSITASRRSTEPVERRSSNHCKEIILGDKGEAEAVLDTLLDSIDQYEKVAVGELYDLVGESTTNTDYKYGWTNLSSAAVVRVREGYLLKLPRPVPIG